MTSTPAYSDNSAGSRLLALLATLDLTRNSCDADDIHRVRVAIKKARAWLKLCRAVSGKTAQYQQLVTNLRSLSDGLAGQRDRDVALQTLAKLGRKYPGNKAHRLIAQLSSEIMQRPPPTLEIPALNETITQIRRNLLPFTELIIPADMQFEVIQQRYKNMCQHGAIALHSKTCDDLHAWRKQVKTFGYQLGMAEPHIKKLTRRITRLGNKLGKIHDLCFLQVMLEAIGHSRDLTPLYKRIEKEHKALLRTCRKHYRHVCQPRQHLSQVD